MGWPIVVPIDRSLLTPRHRADAAYRKHNERVGTIFRTCPDCPRVIAWDRVAGGDTWRPTSCVCASAR